MLVDFNSKIYSLLGKSQHSQWNIFQACQLQNLVELFRRLYSNSAHKYSDRTIKHNYHVPTVTVTVSVCFLYIV